MKRISVLIVTLLFVLLSGCMRYGTREGNIQKAEGAYLQFVGDIEAGKPVELLVDDSEKIAITVIEKADQKDFDPRDLYQIKPGKHRVKVFVSGELVVDQLLYVASGEIKEVFLK
jgi:hypothetical protein